jgi:NAD-dependent dihydropyrimidine dehydrogenase PreA subunit
LLGIFKAIFLLLSPCILQNEVEDKVITNDDVLGDAVPYDQQDALRVVCYRLLEMPPVRGHAQFPGSHPVSLNRWLTVIWTSCIVCNTSNLLVSVLSPLSLTCYLCVLISDVLWGFAESKTVESSL